MVKVTEMTEAQADRNVLMTDLVLSMETSEMENLSGRSTRTESSLPLAK